MKYICIIFTDKSSFSCCKLHLGVTHALAKRCISSGKNLLCFACVKVNFTSLEFISENGLGLFWQCVTALSPPPCCRRTSEQVGAGLFGECERGEMQILEQLYRTNWLCNFMPYQTILK